MIVVIAVHIGNGRMRRASSGTTTVSPGRILPSSP